MKVLVTGGGGFLGGAIVRRLVARGDSVRSFSRGSYPELDALGVEPSRGDLADPSAVRRAVAGVEAVVHAAALPGVWGREADFVAANVVGTRNVVDACRAEGVRRLVHTSSPSVVFDGDHMEGADESAPYAAHFETHYPRTKAEAERLALAAADDSLGVVALRPHLVWGPGDRNLVPRILARAARLRVVGDGRNRVDATYIDNAADAHILALDRIAPGAPISGKAYFVADDDPRPLWEIVNRILAAGGKPPVKGRVPAGVAVAIGAAFETVYGALGIRSEPPMTRFVAREMATSHWFDLTAAKRDLGYVPRVSFDEGMARLKAWLDENPGGLPR